MKPVCSDKIRHSNAIEILPHSFMSCYVRIWCFLMDFEVLCSVFRASGFISTYVDEMHVCRLDRRFTQLMSKVKISKLKMWKEKSRRKILSFVIILTSTYLLSTLLYFDIFTFRVFINQHFSFRLN